jgi:hypothetical protein
MAGDHGLNRGGDAIVIRCGALPEQRRTALNAMKVAAAQSR